MCNAEHKNVFRDSLNEEFSDTIVQENRFENIIFESVTLASSEGIWQKAEFNYTMVQQNLSENIIFESVTS